ncbi:Uncharacterised protein [Klebsiella pneumoniae]|uniref:Uncharacterized protein n=1 Tax=Klebsiella pneumoniae TaxID=573 RepID=A0A378AJN2_KLEPN|nr:Uncharacterised protein [Klebsiella pneumoniae]
MVLPTSVSVPVTKKRLVTLNDSCKKRIRQRADALPLRPGQLQLAQFAAAKRGGCPSLVQMGGADAFSERNSAQRIGERQANLMNLAVARRPRSAARTAASLRKRLACGRSSMACHA